MQNLDSLNVVELNLDEMTDIDAGGVVGTTLRVVGTLCLAAAEILNACGI